MSIQSLRSTDASNGHWRDILSSLSHERITLTEIRERNADTLIDDYPFDGQLILYGNLEYEEEYEEDVDPRYRRTVEGSFEFRTQSEMFILRMDTDMPRPDTIIRDLNAMLAQELKIYHNLFVNSECLWDFFNQASEILELTVLIEGREHSLDEAFDFRLDDTEVTLAELEDLHGGEVEGVSIDEIVGSYPVQRAKVVFEYDGSSFIVKYTEGSLSIRNASEEHNEYVIQLFERDVLAR